MNINDLFNVEGKIAVVTGGSRGIGEMITAGFLANGVKVYITARKVGPLISKAEELSEKYNGECIALGCDLSTLDGVKSFAEQIKEKEDGIDFLIKTFESINVFCQRRTKKSRPAMKEVVSRMINFQKGVSRRSVR